MWFYWFMLSCDLLIPLIMSIGGFLMYKHSPKKINGFLGYRTSRSMKNESTWRFAHEYCGKLWIKVGLIILILSALIHIPFYRQSEIALSVLSLVLMAIQLAFLAISIVKTEEQLKRRFNDDGTEKHIKVESGEQKTV